MITNATHRARFTVPAVGEGQTVRVAAFRDQIAALERVCRVDFHACATPAELDRWVESARRVGRELISMDCKRASAELWERREAAIERSTTLIGSVVYGDAKARLERARARAARISRQLGYLRARS